ncbi:MAG: hypothetical protein ACFE9R_16695, partial [Candidatus Hermodarchaeota archaeon]
MAKIKIGIVGVGNCASALIQGIEYYKNANNGGLTRTKLAGYHITDIEIVAAIDISQNKVGKDLSSAIFVSDLEPIVKIDKSFDL